MVMSILHETFQNDEFLKIDIFTFLSFYFFCLVLKWAEPLVGLIIIQYHAGASHLWLQWQGPPMHAAAATATLFSQTLIKHLKY